MRTMYKVLEDINFLEEIILKKGDFITFDEKDNIVIGSIRLSKDSISSKISEVQDLDISINKLEDLDEPKMYRIQLDVKTTKNNLFKIEKILREKLQDLL